MWIYECANGTSRLRGRLFSCINTSFALDRSIIRPSLMCSRYPNLDLSRAGSKFVTSGPIRLRAAKRYLHWSVAGDLWEIRSQPPPKVVVEVFRGAEGPVRPISTRSPSQANLYLAPRSLRRLRHSRFHLLSFFALLVVQDQLLQLLLFNLVL